MATIYKNEHSYCGPISMLKRLANEDIVVVFREALWRGVTTHADPTTRTSMVRSTDNGETWHTQVTPDPSGGNGASINQLNDGTLIVNNFHWVFVPLSRREELRDRGGYKELDALKVASARGGVFTTRSLDNGYTWEPPRMLETPGYDTGSTAGRIIELNDGSLLAPLNGERPGDSSNRSWVAWSADGGATWAFRSDVAAAPGIDFAEMRILLLPSGRILALIRTPNPNFYQSRSDDQGKTWDPIRETPIWCAGSSPADLLLLRDGRVLCTYARRIPPFGVRACLSEDEGETWDIRNEVVLRDDGLDRDMGYPSSEQLDDETVLTVYYWHGTDDVRYLASDRWKLNS